MEPLRQASKIALCRRSLLDFTLATCDGYEANWFHREVCAELDQFHADVIARKSPRLMVFAPPRHGKSEIISRRYPAWGLGKNPDLEIISTSYAADLASRMNRDVQRIIEAPSYAPIFPDTRLATGKDNAIRTSDLFEIPGHRGSYRSAGVGGGITGAGAHVLLIDDPIANAEQAYSEVYRERVWNWFSTTAYTRLMPGGGVLIILTRWHDDDLAGRLLAAMAKGGEKWRVVSYPAIATRVEPHRVIGDALHPERYSVADLKRIRSAVGTFAFDSLYQQSPVPAGGGMFPSSWWRWYRVGKHTVAGARPEGANTLPPRALPLEFDSISMSVDCNFKEADTSDYVALTVWGRVGADSYLLHMFRERTGINGTIKAIRDAYAAFPDIGAIIVEEAANGFAVVEVLKSEIPGIIAVKPIGGKEARAAAIQPQVEAGNVYLPEGVSWVGDYVLEFAKFPKGANDDMVDSTSQLLTWEHSSDVRRLEMLCSL